MKRENRNNTDKVFVAMSGGVDSSVAAALLQQAGYDVTGVFIRGWYPEWLPCNWREERHDAMRVCAHLGIPFETMNLERAYKEEVIEYLIAEYTQGRTPNPDIMCNKSVKFGAFFRNARLRGADMIATGHYARIHHNGDGRPHMHIGVDTEKDQSYFLWTLTPDILERTLFPVGSFAKPQVREYARAFHLPTADKKDSQGICFLGTVDMREFLRHYVPTAPGEVHNQRGENIGTHEGAILYTLGQRHGFTVTAKTPEAGPHYVVAKDVAANTITVSENPYAPAFTVRGTVLASVNWVVGAPAVGQTCQVRFRYRQELRPAVVEAYTDATARIVFNEPQSAVAPGQSVVFYTGDECVGGGVIRETV